MRNAQPRVSIAVPVYNGEKYIAEAVESILGQSYADFEVILCDNASTDRTESICREFALRDPRVRYVRSPVNRGIHRNFTRGAQLSQGEYFMWLAHDDKLAPEFLKSCVTVLDSEPDAVLAYPKAIEIDDQSEPIAYKEQSLNVTSLHPHERFREMMRMEHNCEALFGLLRGAIVRRTGLLGNYADADRVLLAELALYGRYSRIPEFLFLHREHVQRATNVYRTRFERTASLTPEDPGRIVFPHFRQFFEYLRAIGRAPLSWVERLRCGWATLQWVGQYWKRLLRDANVAARHVLRRILSARVSGQTPTGTSGRSI